MNITTERKINEGSLYLTKQRKKDIDALRAEEGKAFTMWIDQNYLDIQREIKTKFGKVNQDVLNDTFLYIHDKILYSEFNLDSYRGYFMRAYAINLLKNKVAESKKKHIDDIENKEYLSTINEEEDHKKFPVALFLKYVEDNYSIQDYELYKMYMLCKPKQSYRDIAKLTNMLIGTVRRKLSCITKTLREKKDEIMKNESINT